MRRECASLLPVFVERLGDAKGRISAQAISCLLDTYKTCPTETEKAVKELGMDAKNPRAREQSLQWLIQMYRTVPGFSFRSYTPYLMKMLEDADATVRETAKDVVVELFKNAPDHAKADLKKELTRAGVRKAIATHIVSNLGLPGGGDLEPRAGAKTPHQEEDESGKAPSVAAGPSFMSTLPGTELEHLEPDYVNTNRELEEIFQDMIPAFDGKESEQNWLAREKNCLKIRKLARGNAFKDYQATFLAGVKGLLDGILKAVNSLRTTLSTSGCQLIKDLAIICGPGLDPMVEILLSNLIKVCANTKKITAQMGQVTTSIVLANVSYHPKILQHIWNACQDKNVQPRSFATGWVILMLEVHASHKGYLEHTGGLDTIEKCIKRGLADANPGVREGMRKAYWKFATIWPDRAEIIMDGLESGTKKLLEKENPNGPGGAKVAPGKAPLNRNANATVARPSIKEVLAQKRAKLQRAETAPAPPLAPQPAPPIATAPQGISQAPVRPSRPKVRTAPEGAGIRGVTANAGDGGRAAANRAVSPSTTHSSTAKESPMHFSRRSPQPPSSPPQTMRVANRAPAKVQSPQVTSRKLSLLDQLNHSDWRVRVEGIITVACILAKKDPPNYDGQSKMPTLPPSDVLAPTLAKLLNDPQPEVVEHVVAPEVLTELHKVVPMEHIMTKVLLLSEGDDEDHSLPIMQSSMPALKSMLTVAESAELIFRVMTSLGAFGTVPRKFTSPTSYTNTQKKKIIHGCLVWMSELVELVHEGVENEYLTDRNNYKTYVSRLIQMLSSTKPPNYLQLAMLLRAMRKMDPETFDKILYTFEAATVRDLKRAWGQPMEETAEYIPAEEKVAHVQEVLGVVPVIPRVRHVSPEVTSPTLRARKIRDFSPMDMQPDLTRSVSGASSVPPVPRTPLLGGAAISRPDDKENKSAEQLKEHVSSSPNGNGMVKVVASANGSSASNERAASSRPASSTISESQRSKLKRQISNTNLPKTPEHTAHLLASLIDRLRSRNIDAQSLRKLIGIARENPVRAATSDATSEISSSDIWDGGKVFDELLVALLDFLADDDVCSMSEYSLIQLLTFANSSILNVRPICECKLCLFSSSFSLRLLLICHRHLPQGPINMHSSAR